MKIYDCIQGTPEWSYLRAGLPTASQFDRIVTPKGKISTQAERYMFELLAERMMGHPVTEYMSHWMDRGSQTEAEAVRFYEFTRDESTVKVGFITNDAGTIGASPDRLVGERGLLEIKVPKESTHVAYMMQSGSAYEEYRVQTQGQLWIAEREWNDLLSYHPELPEAIIRIGRDDLFIKILESAVTAFSEQLEEQWEFCKSRGWVSEKPKESQVKTASEYMKEALLEVNRK